MASGLGQSAAGTDYYDYYVRHKDLWVGHDLLCVTVQKAPLYAPPLHSSQVISSTVMS